MKRYLSLFINFFLIISLLAPVSAVAAPRPPTPVTPGETPVQQAIDQAIKNAINANKSKTLFYAIYEARVEQIQLNSANDLAVAWLMPVDPVTGQVVPTEPSTVVARLAADGTTWQVSLPTSPDYAAVISGLPDSLMGRAQREMLAGQLSVTPLSTQTLTGYYLPWLGGTGKYLSGSIWHSLPPGYMSCPKDCFNAFDFWGLSENNSDYYFRLLASKSGIVSAYYDGWNNGNHGSGSNCDNYVNYIVIKDPTTSPVTYMLYYHLAQGTIPFNLKHVGALVNTGDFIGRADDTGCSSGSHIHFMVYAAPYSDHWGTSVDIAFNDVSINNGHPRRCDEAKAYPQYGAACMLNDYYVSGNRAATPPSGSLTAPAAWTVVSGPTVNVAGSGSDNSAVINLQIVADYDGAWKPVSSTFTANPFNINLDLCAAGVPDGPLTLGLWVWDDEGTRTLTAQTPRPIIKNYSCQPPPPPCNPTMDQVALFSLPDYQGSCQVFSATGGINSAGIYDTASLGAVGDNNAASIQVGANVMATVYDLNYTADAFSGRAETFDSSDPGLGDNRIGTGHVSSLYVKPLAVPTAPVLYTPLNISGNVITAADSFLLTWSGDNSGVEYQAELTYPDQTKSTSPWLRATAWPVGTVPAGNYSWVVTARNRIGSLKSNPSIFTVNAGNLSGSAVSFPYADNMSSGVNFWTSTGLWRQSSSNANGEDANNIFWVSNKSSNGTNPSDGTYASSTTFASDLTSPPITIPTGTSAYLRFREYVHTESPAPYWDQRLVQISVNNGPFTNLYQMQDDPQDWWVYSPFLNLSAYAGKNVRIRFHFNQVDAYDNTHIGWRIDDVTVNTTAPDVTYAESTPNDSPTQATPLPMNSTIYAYICPAGDLDYYSFTVNAGDTVNFNIDAQSLNPPSSLDSYIFLIDSDGHSVIAENDDEVPWVVRDSNLTYTFHRSGAYYLKVKSWSFPGSSALSYVCSNFFYTLKMYGSSFPPAITFTTPTLPWVGLNPVDVTAQISVASSGLASVNFLWHSPDWVNDTWVPLSGVAANTNGWKATLDPAGKTINGSSLVARATDRVGLSSTTWVVSLLSDTTPPTTHLTGPTADNLSTVIPLTWSAFDNDSGISTIEIQYKDITAGTDWQPWNVTFGSSVRQAYFLGQPGHTYGFKIHGIDKVGNVEPYSTGPEIQPSIAATCTPDASDTAPANDGSPATASLLVLGAAQTHNFCPSGDQDWLNFSVPAAGDYPIRVQSLAGGAAINLNVTSANGQTVLAQGQSPALGSGFDLKFSAAAAGDYKLHLSALYAELWGTDMQYSVLIGKVNIVFMPLVGK
ncbi:MAG TPA: pre-peptidase C-terminal domain-containing protein [Anaerolineaceae bacterium]